jgi:hypothetical protein
MMLNPPNNCWLIPLGVRLAIIGLLIAVAGLATVAKNGQYFPRANPAHHVSISTKLNVAYAKTSVSFDQGQPAIPVVIVAPVITVKRQPPFDMPLPNRMAPSTCTQLRSPPYA